MVKVGPNAGGVRHHVGDVVLLMDAVKQVCHGALGKDCHIFSAVGLMAQGDGRLSLVVVVSCRPETSFESLPGPQCCERSTPFPLPPDWLEGPFHRRGSQGSLSTQGGGDKVGGSGLGSGGMGWWWWWQQYFTRGNWVRTQACLTQKTTLSGPHRVAT